jgi:hypothetical protein
VLEEESSLAEEAIRAMRELAHTVTDAPPLRLAPRRGASGPRRSRQRSWALWAVPLTAAVAVIALAVALVTIRDLPNGRVVPPTSSASPSAAGVPTYYAAPETVCRTCQSTRLVVGDTFTGAKLATFTPPHGTTFEAVSAAADDRTFVADTVEFPFNVATQHVTWYLLKITPGASAPVRLTRLHIPATPAAAWLGTVVLSPSGRELAVTYQFRHATPMTTALRIYSVATGKLLRSWSTDTDVGLGPFDFAPYVQSNNQLSWTGGDRALSFTTRTYTGQPLRPTGLVLAVRTLNLATGGGDLIRDSRVVWSKQVSAGGAASAQLVCSGDTSLTANGKTVVCDGLGGYLLPGAGNKKTSRSPWRLLWGEYQISTPKVAHTLHEFTAYSTGRDSYTSAISVQWADASGSTLIVAWSIASTAPPVTRFGLISQGKLIPLPAPHGITLGTPPDIAW